MFTFNIYNKGALKGRFTSVVEALNALNTEGDYIPDCHGDVWFIVKDNRILKVLGDEVQEVRDLGE